MEYGSCGVRKRVVRACDYCRRKRLRCTATQYPCTNCQLYRTQCVYSGRKSRAGGDISTALAAATPGRIANISPAPSMVTKLPQFTEFSKVPALMDHGGAPRLEVMNEQQQNEVQTPRGTIEQPLGSQNSGMSYRKSGSRSLMDAWNGDEPFSEGSPTENFDFTSIFFDSLWTGADQSMRNLTGQGTENLANYQPQVPLSMVSIGNGKVSGIDALLQKGTPVNGKAQIPPGLFVRKDNFNSNFIGLHSTGAILGFCMKESIERHHELIGYNALQSLIPAGRYVDEAGVQTITDVSLYELPEREFSENGVNAYFENVHLLFPIIEAERFRLNWPRLYDCELRRLSSFADYSEFHLIITIGVLSRPRNTDPASHVEGLCHNLYERSWKMLSDILISPNIGSVRILLLHTIYHILSGRLGFAWVICGLAIRIAQSLGLHRRSPQDLDMSDQQIRYRSQLWWVAYSLDSFVSETQGRPTATTDSETDTEFFPLISEDHVSQSLVAPALDIYGWNIKFSWIRNRFCSLLNRNETMLARLDAIAQIDTALLRWRDEIPVEYQPDQENLAPPQIYRLVGFLHLEYFNMMRAIHWMSFITAQAIREVTPSHQSARIRGSESICLAASRSLIKTMNDITAHEDQDGVYQIKLQINHCISALAIIFRNIFRYPHKLSARADLEIFRAGKIHIERDTHSEPDVQTSVFVISTMMDAADRLLGVASALKVV